MKKKTAIKKITAEELERKFDAGESIMEYLDLENAVRRVNIDIPEWAVKQMDAEAARRGITRQSLIKTWLIDRLDDMAKVKAAG